MSEDAAGLAGAEPMQIAVTECLTGRQLEVTALPSDNIETIRQHLAGLLGVSLESVDLQLLSDGRALDDGAVAADLPARGLQCLRVKKTTFAMLPTGPGYKAVGALAPNGKIYFAPSRAPRALAIDPHESTAEMLGPELPRLDKYSAAGVLAPNGKIYFAPSHAARALAIDPHESTVEMLGPELPSLPGPPELEVQGDKYSAAGVLAPNGKIYFAPYHAFRAIAIDPHESTVERLGPELPWLGKYSAAGVLAPNGKIYFAPFHARRALVIDPQESTAEMFGPELRGHGKYPAAGVLAPNGKICFAPDCAQKALIIDP